MAETEFILLPSAVERILDGLLDGGSKIAVDMRSSLPRYDTVERGKYDQLFAGDVVQLFVKNPEFSKADFKLRAIETPSGQKYFIEQLAWDGHIALAFHGKFLPDSSIYSLSIRRGGLLFKEETNEYLRPSSEIKKFYEKLVRQTKKGTRRIQIIKGRNFWVDDRVIASGDHVMEMVAAWHRGVPTKSPVPAVTNANKPLKS